MTRNQQAILWNVWACMAASVMVSIVRHLSHGLDIQMVVFFRYLFALLIFMPWVARKGTKVLHTKQWGRHVLRGVNGIATMYVWFWAVKTIPLSVAVSISFSVPLMVALLSVVFLGERYGVHRWVALLVGFAGVLIVLRPGATSFEPAMLLAVVASIGFAVSSLLVKRLGEGDSPRVVAFYMMLIGTPLAFPAMLYAWQTPTPEQWFWLFMLGAASVVFQTAMTRAFSMADFAVVLPVDFSRMVFVSVIAFFAFHEVPDFWTWVGSSVIMASALYATWRTARHDKQEHKHARHGEASIPG